MPPPTAVATPPAARPQQAYGQRRAARVDHRRPARPEVILGVSLWRLVIVLIALVGLVAAIKESGNGASALEALSQSASLLTALVYGGLLKPSVSAQQAAQRQQPAAYAGGPPMQSHYHGAPY